MPQFDASTFVSQMFWLFLCFGFLLIVMVKSLVPRLGKALSRRKNAIRKDLDTAQEHHVEGRQLEQQDDARIRQARRDTKTMMHRALAEINAEKIMVLREFEHELSQRTAETIKELEKYSTTLKKEIPSMVSDAIILLGPKILPEKSSLTQKAINDIISKTMKKQKERAADV